MSKRTFGWVQNPSSFENLKSLVGIFIPTGHQHSYLLKILDSDLVIKDAKLRATFKEKLLSNLIVLSYADLVGTGTSIRNQAPCDALGQASIKPQKVGKLYTDNWTTDGFVRWAECLGFIIYDESSDSFSVTQRGIDFYSSDVSFAENKALQEAFMSYPPVHRILFELDKAGSNGLSKYELGSKLGFAGESGFTSIPYSLVVDTIIYESDLQYIKKLRSDIEGSADKYARMISGWLIKMGWVANIKREFNNLPNKTVENLGHCFKITLKGRQILSRLNGGSKHTVIPKYVSWNMLATKAQNADYLRTRRYKLLEILNKSNEIKLVELTEKLNEFNLKQGLKLEVNLKNVEKDIAGLNGCGIFVSVEADKAKLISKLLPLKPLTQKVEIENQEIEELKQIALNKYTALPSEWVELIEISRDKDQSTIFEMKVAELFKTCYRIKSLHLGGASKPDCLLWDDSFSVIVDAKAYKDGFPFQASEKDKMVRYLRECERKDKAENATEWWNNFPPELNSNQLFFMFASSFFSSTAEKHLESVSIASKFSGCAWDVDNLLSGANFFLQNPQATLQYHLIRVFSNKVVDAEIFSKS